MLLCTSSNINVCVFDMYTEHLKKPLRKKSKIIHRKFHRKVYPQVVVGEQFRLLTCGSKHENNKKAHELVHTILHDLQETSHQMDQLYIEYILHNFHLATALKIGAVKMIVQLGKQNTISNQRYS